MSEPTPVVIEFALNGITSKAQNPNVPREPGEVVRDALRSFDAGAALVHTHIEQLALPPEAARGVRADRRRAPRRDPLSDHQPWGESVVS